MARSIIGVIVAYIAMFAFSAIGIMVGGKLMRRA